MSDFLNRVNNIKGKALTQRRDAKIIKDCIKTLSSISNSSPGQHTILDQNGIHTRQVLPETDRQIGELVKFGPADEDDFTDAFYWCKICTIDKTKAEPKDIFKSDIYSKIVKAIHPAEIGLGTGGNGVHILFNKPTHITAAEKPRYVILHYIGGLYIIETYPGRIYTSWEFEASCTSASGCPEGGWISSVGTPVISNTAPPICP